MANIKKNLIKDKRGAGTRSLIINIVLATVFIVFTLFFALGFLGVTNPSSTILTQNNLNGTLSSLNNSLNNFTGTAQEVFNQAGSSQPSATDYLFLIFQGAFYIPLSFLGFAFTAIMAIGNILFISFGGGLLGSIVTILIGVATSIGVITLVLYVIKTIRTGQD
jgi:PPE-repeat protein